MRKILMLFAASVMITGCSKDEKDDAIYFINLKLSYGEESDKGPEGRVLIYYIENEHPTKPYFVDIFGYLKDANGEIIIPKCTRNLNSSKNPTTGLYENRSAVSFFANDLFYSQDIPRLGKYLIVVEIESGWDDGTLLGVGQAYYIEDFDLQRETYIEHSIPKKNPERINYW